MATRLAVWMGGIGLCGYLATVGFAASDDATKKILIEKNYGLAPDEETRKKMLFMSVIQGAATGNQAIYRQSKQEIEKSLPKKE